MLCERIHFCSFFEMFCVVYFWLCCFERSKITSNHNRLEASKYSVYGSKLQSVVETILGIWDCEPDAKILVFCQSEERFSAGNARGLQAWVHGFRIV